MSIAKHLKRVDPTPAARAASSALGAPAAPSWAGYWTFVTAAIILMFALYLAQKGRLSVWLQFLSWSNPATNVSASDGSAGQTGIAGAINNAVNGNPVGAAISAATGVAPLTIGGSSGAVINGFLGNVAKTFGFGSSASSSGSK